MVSGFLTHATARLQQLSLPVLGSCAAGAELAVSFHCSRARKSKEMTDFLNFSYCIFSVGNPTLALASETIATNKFSFPETEACTWLFYGWWATREGGARSAELLKF